MNTELKPCPFCGGEAFAYDDGMDCMASCNNVDCFVLPGIVGCKTIDEAVSKWNRRTEQASQPQWIPISERLPEECIPVLCFRNGIRIGYYDKGAWFDFQGYEWAHARTHWMPLPAAPKNAV